VYLNKRTNCRNTKSPAYEFNNSKIQKKILLAATAGAAEDKIYETVEEKISTATGLPSPCQDTANITDSLYLNLKTNF
jgi:hypothetical protein